MHRAGVVRKQQTTLPQLSDQLIERGLADPVHAMIPDCSRDLLAYCRVVLCPEQNPVCSGLRADPRRDLGKSFGQPSFGRAVFGARAKTDQRLMFDV